MADRITTFSGAFEGDDNGGDGGRPKRLEAGCEGRRAGLSGDSETAQIERRATIVPLDYLLSAACDASEPGSGHYHGLLIRPRRWYDVPAGIALLARGSSAKRA